MHKLDQVSRQRCFDGWQGRYWHYSPVLQCDMHFSIYLPPQAETGPVPAVYWLSGLTCTDENFVTKAGAQRVASELGIALVCPDTSPRGEGVADDPEGNWDLGLGAGFYVNATQAPWQAHYQMYDYVALELPKLVEDNFPVSAVRSISGHSMGGHGALVVGLRNPERYASISAFAPIVNPTDCPWGQKAFANYLGQDRTSWLAYDACALLAKAGQKVPMLVDQGAADNFLEEQLKPERLRAVAEEVEYPLVMNIHEGYDHSYYFMASFIEYHLRFHAEQLLPGSGTSPR